MDTCRICNLTSDNEVFVAREMMFGLRHQFAYFQCSGCRCLQIRDIPADMTPYYPSNYYSMQTKLSAPGRGARAALTALESRFRRYVNNGIFRADRRTRIFGWMRATDTHYDSAILDVGCGRGALLHDLHVLGFRDLTGADPFVTDELRYDNGIVIHKRELSQLDRRFDLIMMHSTFEHVAEPEATLRAAADRLQPGRFLLLRIPLVDCYAWRHYGINWFALDAPRHFHLHTEKSVELLAHRTGFSVRQVKYDSAAHQLWGSEQYLRDIPHHSPNSHADNPTGSMFSASQLREFERSTRELNAKRDGDAACFYLVRD